LIQEAPKDPGDTTAGSEGGDPVVRKARERTRKTAVKATTMKTIFADYNAMVPVSGPMAQTISAMPLSV
jgi:hypothetical protein